MSGIEAQALEQLRRTCPAAFYRPNKPAPDAFIVAHGGDPGSRSQGDRPFFESAARTRAALGGNRSAKSCKCVLEAGSFAMKFRPWYPPSDPYFTLGLARSNKPRVRFVVPNFSVHMPDVIAELEKWWPRELWRVTSRDNTGNPRTLEWITGATWVFMSHKMDPEDFEGTESDLIVWNEPPPRPLWIAGQRGLVSTGGRAIIGATVLESSSWFNNEIVSRYDENPTEDFEIFWHSIWDNTVENSYEEAGSRSGAPYQTCGSVRAFLDTILDPEEKIARQHGIPYSMGGLILKSLVDEHWVDPYPVPRDATIVACIDPAGARPYAGLWIAYSPDPELGWIGYVFDELFLLQNRHTLEEFAGHWIAKDNGEDDLPIFHPAPAALVLIDPVSNQEVKTDRMGRTLREIILEDHKISTTSAQRANKRAGLLSLNADVHAGHYRISYACTRLRAEAKAWIWDASSPKLTKGADDMGDNWRYIHQLGPHNILGLASEDGDPSRHGVYIPPEYQDPEPAERYLRVEQQRRLASKHVLTTRSGPSGSWSGDFNDLDSID